MTETSDDERVITRGDNNPPEGILPILPPTEADEKARADALTRAEAAQTAGESPAFNLSAFASLEAATMAFCDAAGAWQRIKVIGTPAQSERLTDFVTGARQLYKRVDDQRKGDKAPWDAGGKKVQDAYSPLLNKLDTIGKVMKGMQADWLLREEQRLSEEKRVAEAEAAKAKEEAERQLAQAAARGDISAQIDAEAALKDAEKAQKSAAKPVKARAGTATGAGRTMSLRKQRVAEITNPRACFAAFKDEPAVVEALLRCANEAIRSGFTDEQALIAGFKIIEKNAAA